MLPKINAPKKTIYLDYAAATPLDLSVKKLMDPYWSQEFGNPASLYDQGRRAQAALHKARSGVAELIGAKPEEIIFTAGGTESINLAIFGVARGLLHNQKAHFITSSIEHHAVLRSFEQLERDGHVVTYLGVNPEGFVSVQELEKAIRPDTVLVSIMYANNEIGTIEPIGAVGKLLQKINQYRTQNGLSRILFHSDACQAAGALDTSVAHLGVDLLTVNGSKVYGPKQSGFLYVRSGTKLSPLVFGGGQEQNLRSGTENVPGTIGLAESFRLVQKNLKKENLRLRKLRDFLISQLLKKIPGAIVNGPMGDTEDKKSRLPNNINISIPGVDGEALILYLNGYNIAASTGSACSSVSQDPSHVLKALGRSDAEIAGSVRLTLGKNTTKQELEYVLAVVPGLVEELKRIG